MGNLVDYNKTDTRIVDFNSIKLDMNDIRVVPYSLANNDTYYVLEFDVSNEIATIAYNLCNWLKNDVTDKDGMFDRDDDVKEFNLFTGIVSEILMFKYLELIGIKHLEYYNIIRSSSVLKYTEEFDIKINGETMSVKIYSDAICTKESHLKYEYLNSTKIIRSKNMNDKYFTQFFLKCTTYNNYKDTMDIFKDNISKNKALDVRFCLLGGIYNDGQSISWNSKSNTDGKLEFVNFKSDEYSFLNYIQTIMRKNR